MRRWFRSRMGWSVLCICSPGSFACSGDGPSMAEPPEVALTGVVQKGPFILGSRISASPLDDAGAPTGQHFEASTANDLGEFTVQGLPVGPVALTAEGYYFDEVRAGLSGGPLTLRAVHHATVDATAVNLHVMTHLDPLPVPSVAPDARRRE